MDVKIENENRLRILDNILKFLSKEQNDAMSFSLDEINTGLVNDYNYEMDGYFVNTIYEYLLYLEENKYIKNINKEFKDREQSPGTGSFKITTNGIIFSEQNGYTGKLKKEVTLSKLQSIQTWAIAVGTILASIGTIGLLFFEWLKYFNPRH